MPRFVLDTNILTKIVKRDREVLREFEAALTAGTQIVTCPMAYYELRRGLLHRNAAAQLTDLDAIVRDSTWEDFSREDWERGAEYWAEARLRGQATDDDGDVLIAAFVTVHQATLITHNSADFEDFGVQCADWVS